MTGCTRKKSNLALQLLLLSCSLPLLFASPAWAQKCTEAEIKANIQKFNTKNNSVLLSAYNAIVKCGSKSLKPLIAAVKDQKAGSRVRPYAAITLEKIKPGSKEALNALIAIMRDQKADSDVRRNAASALGNIGLNSKEALNALIAIMRDQKANSDVRRNAAEVLWFIELNSKEASKEVFNAMIAVVQDQKAGSDVRSYAASALGRFGLNSKEALNALIAVVQDQKADSGFRINAAEALGNIGSNSKEAVNALIAAVRDQKAEPQLHSSAAEALGKIGSNSKEAVNALIAVLQDQKANFIIHRNAANALGKIGSNSKEAVNALIAVVQDQKADSTVRYYAADALGKIGSKLDKNKKQLSTENLNQFIAQFEKATQVLEADKQNKIFNEKTVSDVRAYLDRLKQEKQSRWQEQLIPKFGAVILLHFGFWVLLIFLYPKSRKVQAMFFWNPWMRKIFGVGYVGLALTSIPFLRAKLFTPFKESLLSDAQLDTFDPKAYFADSKVKLKGETDAKPIKQAIPEIQGQIILEGESGLGKSMFLRNLVQSSPRIVVYLPAQKCTQGVMEAIKNKLHGYVKEDPHFLQRLIYIGAIDICIDGLNEVTPDTRSKITSFVENNFKGNIMMATQPLEWSPPPTAKTYVLQPLENPQIEQFLLSREYILNKNHLIIVSNYQQDCNNYLATALNQQYSSEEESAIRRMLSNPMDLTVIALMLAQGKKPDLLNLQQQLYQEMAAYYQRLYPSEFPLDKFSEAVYQMRLNDESAIPADSWLDELQCMERYKMVYSRQLTDAENNPIKKWYFRHDKIQEFFIVQTFLGNDGDTEKRLQDHISDPRFRGVYFLLATMMPLDAATKLRETLIQYAADTKDHSVSDTFVQLFRSRKAP